MRRLSRNILADGRRGIAEAGYGTEGGLDFTQLDAEAADLHLEVGAAEGSKAFRQRANAQGLRAINEPGSGKGLGDEGERSDIGPAEIAVREVRTADEELSTTPVGTGCRRSRT